MSHSTSSQNESVITSQPWPSVWSTTNFQPPKLSMGSILEWISDLETRIHSFSFPEIQLLGSFSFGFSDEISRIRPLQFQTNCNSCVLKSSIFLRPKNIEKRTFQWPVPACLTKEPAASSNRFSISLFIRFIVRTVAISGTRPWTFHLNRFYRVSAASLCSAFYSSFIRLSRSLSHSGTMNSSVALPSGS